MAEAASAALPGFQSAAEPMGLTITLLTIAEAARGLGDLAGAMAGLAQAEAFCREIGFAWGQAAALFLAGEVARDQGAVAAASGLFARGLALYHAQQDRWGIGVSLAGLGTIAMIRDAPRTAAHLLAAAGMIAAKIGAALPPFDTGVYDQYLAAVRAALGDQAFAAAWQEGQELPLDAVVAEAAALASHTAPAAGAAKSDSPIPALSPRLADVARLVAQGMQNREIAQALYLSENTVKGYVHEIIGRLGLRNRTEVSDYVNHLVRDRP